MYVGDVIDMSQALEEHVKVEVKMIKRLESMKEKTLDDRISAILCYMLSEERRHHNTLKRMVDLISQSEIKKV